MPNRTQVELRPSDLGALLPAGQRARLVWDCVTRANLGRIYVGIGAVERGSGLTAIAPEILFALWLYAALDKDGHGAGVGAIDRSA